MSRKTFLAVLVELIAIIIATAENQSLRNYPPPNRLRVPLQTEFRQINSGSPPDPYPKAALALTLPIISDEEPWSLQIIDDIKAGLGYVMQTKNDITLALQGSGRLGVNTMLDNLIEEGDKVLILSAGYWGDMMANMSQRLGARVVTYSKTPGTRYNLQEIDSALQMHRPVILGMVQAESSTSVRQPMKGIGKLCKKYGALFVVDIVSAIGMQPIFMDELEIDAVAASSNKGIGAVAGSALISFSERAGEKLRNRKSLPRFFTNDLNKHYPLWNTSSATLDTTIRHRPYSLSMPLLYSLREALATIVEEGLENSIKRHEAATAQLHKGLFDLGLRLAVPDPRNRMVGITVVLPPRGKDSTKIATFMFNKFRVEISTTFAGIDGLALRLSTFGMNADTQRVQKLLFALNAALQSPETNIKFQ